MRLLKLSILNSQVSSNGWRYYYHYQISMCSSKSLVIVDGQIVYDEDWDKFCLV